MLDTKGNLVVVDHLHTLLKHHFGGCMKVCWYVYRWGGCSQFLYIVLIQLGQVHHLDHMLHCAEPGQLKQFIVNGSSHVVELVNTVLLPIVGYPSCLHTTWASVESQLLSQTVPHKPPEHSSTLPCQLLLPSDTLMAPSTVQFSGEIKEREWERERNLGPNIYIFEIKGQVNCTWAFYTSIMMMTTARGSMITVQEPILTTSTLDIV